MAVALCVEGVSKQYRIYERPVDRLKETLTRGRWKTHREFWPSGTSVLRSSRPQPFGIIGPNGSGKSTLLQIGRRTLEPTHGSVRHNRPYRRPAGTWRGFSPGIHWPGKRLHEFLADGIFARRNEGMMPEIDASQRSAISFINPLRPIRGHVCPSCFCDGDQCNAANLDCLMKLWPSATPSFNIAACAGSGKCRKAG